ncbi:MAG TPA: hypothetical protein VFC15_01005 [Candidatus Limnocylindrales bacterium]|nr:hypothetical protein [Candidatus Limnocylindrales bacterium]
MARCFATGHTRTAAMGPAVRLNMYRFETSYDLPITTHQPAAPEEKQYLLAVLYKPDVSAEPRL